MSRMGSYASFFCCAGFAGSIAGTTFAQSIVEIGRLPGGTYSFSSAISDDGAVVVGDADTTNGVSRGFRWTPGGGLAALSPVPGASYSSGFGVSGNGLVVIGVSGSTHDVAARWLQGSSPLSLGALSPGMPSFAFDASFDGSIIVGDGYYASGIQRAFRWTAATGLQAFGLLLPGTSHSLALAISADGNKIAGYCYNNAPALVWPTACRWDSNGAVVSLGVLPGQEMSVPGRMNADGTVVVGYSSAGDGSGAHPFRWTVGGGMQDLGLPIGALTAVAGTVTADGNTVAGHWSDATDVHAMIWTAADGAQDLTQYFQSRGISTSGWTLRTAAISADGSAFTGWGLHNGQNTSWYVGLGCIAPAITSEPQSQTVASGASVSFSVLASGSSNHYQWYKDANAIAGATSSTFSIVSASGGDAGTYLCHIDNACGSAISAPATLTVQTGGGTCVGDLDEDGDVDVADLATSLAHFGETEGVSPEDGDLDGDSDLDLSDLTILLANFGASCP